MRRSYCCVGQSHLIGIRTMDTTGIPTTGLSMDTLKNSSIHEKPLKEHWQTQNGGLCSMLIYY